MTVSDGSPGQGGRAAEPTDARAEMFGPYRLEGRLGRGGMGEVHRAYDTRRDRTVALKRLTPELAEDVEIRERFERECRTAARLSSPHVVPIHDFGVIDGRLFLDMRLIEGRDLARLLREEGALDPVRAVGIVSQLADALDDAHAHDLVHRDVKPGNVLVTSARGQDFVHLVDFGIVRLGQSSGGRSLTEAGTALGTLAYMAPEQFEGTGIDRRADVYALAVVLYEALVGRPPFDGDMPSMLHQHLRVTPVAPSVRRPGVPPGLDAVVLRGLAKSPGDRYAEAGELAEAARGALDGRAAPPPREQPVPPPGGPSTAERHRETWVPTGPPSSPGGIPVSSGAPPYAPGGHRSGPQAPFPVGGPPSGGQVHWDSGQRGTAPWSPGPPGQPPGRQGPQPRRRRGLVIGLVAVALVLVAAVTATVVVLNQGGTTPVLALGPTITLAQAFPDSTASGCSAGDVSGFGINGGAQPEAVAQCTRGASTLAYTLWSTAADAEARVASYTSDQSVDGGITTWQNANTTQGPYWQAISYGQCNLVAGYTGLRYVVQVYTETPDCAGVNATFASSPLPTSQELRAVEAVFPGAARTGCASATPLAGRSGLTPLQARTCPGAEGTTVTWTRWPNAGDVVGEANARRAAYGDADVNSWNAMGGPRQGAYVRGEDGTTCRAMLGWDAAPYAIEVSGPDCDAVDRTVSALGPPPAGTLPT
ncbi:serine/threonine-protein kinase [Actinomycetospora sp. CA-101289]|uniref:serine/threonine-protein kinase n=1 Tax=Actinomycetospora sp. CA-101289 TaxID=3239893 RepID=UPI003D99649B